MIDYCKGNDIDSTDLHVSEVMELMDAYGDHVSEYNLKSILKTTK